MFSGLIDFWYFWREDRLTLSQERRAMFIRMERQ